jgi:SPW repeat
MADDTRVRAPIPARGAARRRGAGRAPQPVDPAAVPPRAQPAPAPAPRGWRRDVIGLSGLNVLAGIWLILAPWWLGYSGADPKWNDVVFGAIVAVLAATRAGGGFRATELSILNALVGVWLFVAAFTIDSSGAAGANDIILGVIVFVLALGSAAASERRAGMAA